MTRHRLFNIPYFVTMDASLPLGTVKGHSTFSQNKNKQTKSLAVFLSMLS